MGKLCSRRIGAWIAMACLAVFASAQRAEEPRSHSLLPQLETSRLVKEADLARDQRAWPIYCEVLAEFEGGVPHFAPPTLEHRRAEFEAWRHLVPRLVEASRLPYGKSYDAAVCSSERADACDRFGASSEARRMRDRWRESYVESTHLEDRRVDVSGLLESRGLVNLLVLAAHEACERGAFDEAFDDLDAAHAMGRQLMSRDLAFECLIGIALSSIALEQSIVMLEHHATTMDAATLLRFSQRAVCAHGFSALDASPLPIDLDPSESRVVTGVRDAQRRLESLRRDLVAQVAAMGTARG